MNHFPCFCVKKELGITARNPQLECKKMSVSIMHLITSPIAPQPHAYHIETCILLLLSSKVLAKGPISFLLVC